MHTRSRRMLLRDGVLTVGGAAGGFLTDALLNQPVRAAVSAAPSGNTILVVLQLAGGHDGLHAVVPFTDPAYKSNRPTLALDPASELTKLTGTLALNNKLSALLPLWKNNQMAIITNVGYPQPNLSHFQSMYIWQTLDMTGAQNTSRTGWLGKALETSGASLKDPFTGLDNGVQLATAFMAPDISVPTISTPANFTIAKGPVTGTRRTTDLLKLYSTFASEATNSHYAGYLNTLSQTSATATDELAKAAAAYKPAATYPNTPLAKSLQVIATAITQKLGMRIGYATLGGFDTHANERRTLDTLYDDLGSSVSAFFTDLNKQGVDQNVIMMTWSEFGRRVKENGSNGTDHGTAAPLFVFGPGVAGGIHGDAPDLSNLDKSGNLVFKTDFRSVYATVLNKWLGLDPTAVLGGSYPVLDFIK